ncbi:Coiled-coil domain-containing protein 25 [Tupaia chinensis]|uniref:Coiled-coil domain-containing protein 25 n=1 Tax=Tupaia chinensis TaxID=246437 RepID=L9KJ97_TUPCH|nr:Coiled-coil domain-containing protein 25 [Tupaia chinensis]
MVFMVKQVKRETKVKLSFLDNQESNRFIALIFTVWNVEGEKIEDIPKDVLMDCAHLVKANSIQGCKMNNVNVVYTPWSNLKKTADMDVGQIGFHRQKDVKIVTVEKKVNEILNRLEKTKVERRRNEEKKGNG